MLLWYFLITIVPPIQSIIDSKATQALENPCMKECQEVETGERFGGGGLLQTTTSMPEKLTSPVDLVVTIANELMVSRREMSRIVYLNESIKRNRE